MFDDLDDLLDDIPVNKTKAASSSTNNNTNKKPSTTLLGKTKTTVEDEFDWGADKGVSSQLSFGQSKRIQSAIQPPANNKPSPMPTLNKNIESSTTFGRKSNKKDEDDDLWGLDDWGAENEKSKISGGPQKMSGSFAGNKEQTRDDGRSSMGSNYAGFGILGRPKPASSSGKKKDDDIDNILDDFEEKKGIATQKKNDNDDIGGFGLGTTNKRQEAFGNSKQKFKSSNDPWGRDNLDDLDDLDDKPKPKANLNSDKRAALFGLGSSGGQNTSNQQNDTSQNRSNRFDNKNNIQDLQVNKQQTSKSLGKGFGGLTSGGDDFDNNSGYGGSQGGGYGFVGGAQSNASGNQESQIDVIETPFSRSKTVKKMAGGSQPPPNNRGQNNSLQRPNTGGDNFNNNFGQQNPIQQMNLDRVQTSPVGAQPLFGQQNQPMMQQQQTMQRPNTGGNLFGKPPKHHPQHQQNDFIGGGGLGSGLGDDNILDLLGDSKDRVSNRGSQHSMAGTQHAKPMGSIDNDDDEDQSYGEEQDEDGGEDDDEDSDDLGGYVPTVLGKAGVSSAQKSSAKKSKKKKKQGKQTLNTSGIGNKSIRTGGPQSIMGDRNQHDLNNSDGGRAQTISSEIGQDQFKNHTPYTMGIGGQGKNSSIGSMNQNMISPLFNQSNQNPSQQMQNTQQQMQMTQAQPQPIDEATLVKRQIEDEREKQKANEQRNRKNVDDVREDHKKNMKHLEEKHQMKLHLFNEEKRKLIEEMNKTIELEKEKIGNLHKIDVENREVQYKRNLENQKKVYDSQHDTLRKQLEQQVQLNTFAQEIQKSSGNISNLVSRLSQERESELKRREDALVKRDLELMEKKKKLAERKAQIELRKKKLALEMEDISQRQQEQKLIFENEKNDISNDLDKIDVEHQQQIRESRNHQIDMEVDIRRTKAERERLTITIQQEEKQTNDRTEELNQLKKQVQHQREQMKQEMEQQERDMKQKIRDAKQQQQDVTDEEREYLMKEQDFEQENKQVLLDNEKLQEQLDKYCIDKSQFDREAMKIKEQAERDHMDSEKIGFFKANKDRLLDELRKLREDLEQERESIKEDRVKLEMYKNDIKTRQKTIESIRFEFIKNSQDNGIQFIDSAKDIGYYKIQRYTGGPSFYPINPPNAHESRKENLSPNDRYEQAKTIVQRAQASQNIQDHAPRFNYEDYMKKLKEKLNLDNRKSSGGVGTTDFQMYIMKEREAYLKSLHEFDQDQPLIQSLSQFRRSHANHDNNGIDNHEASFNLGSLQNSVNDKRKWANSGGNGMLNSQIGKSSANSLHFISKNFSNSPVEEVGRDQGKYKL